MDKPKDFMKVKKLRIPVSYDKTIKKMVEDKLASSQSAICRRALRAFFRSEGIDIEGET